MKDILRGNESRRLKVIELLFDKDEWMPLAELSQLSDSSPRILKYDFVHLQDAFDDFSIETSYKGVRLLFRRNRSLKTLYKNVLEHSLSFQLLETIFFDEHFTVNDLAEKFFVSPSTLYRMIDSINDVSKKYDFQVTTNPCTIIGSEEKIRRFFNLYFFEKYTRLNWPYENSKHIGLDNFLKFLIDLRQNKTDFAYYNLFKLATIVNLTRYKNNHFILFKKMYTQSYEHMPDLSAHAETIARFEKSLQIKFTDKFVQQVFFLFIRENYYLDYNELIKAMEANETIEDQVSFLEKTLEYLAEQHQLPLTNKKEIILEIVNSNATEAFDPRAGFILYDRNKHFADVIHESFPHFYQELHGAVSSYRRLAKLPLTENGIHFFIYLIIASWEKILPALRRSLDKINILVISNRHTAHSSMVKDFLEYEFSEQLVIDIYNQPFLQENSIDRNDYDFIISNFPLPLLQSKNWICIENIPTFNDISKIQAEINKVIRKRIHLEVFEK